LEQVIKKITKENYKKMNLDLQMNMILLTIITIPICILLSFIGELLILLNFEINFSILTGNYCKILVISHVPFIYYKIFETFFASQSIILVPMTISIVANILNIILNIIFIYPDSIPFLNIKWYFFII
jgi:multidrug resistance protein, MATE family